MKKRFITIFQYFFFFVLGIFFAWLTFKDIDHAKWLKIKAAISHARYLLIIPVILFLLASHYIRALRWKILMEPLGYKPGNFNTFSAVMVGYLVNSGVPRLGEVVKCTMLARYEKVRVDKLIGTIVVERAVDAISLLIIFLLALIFQGNVFGNFISGLFSNFFRDKTGDLSAVKIIIVISGILFIIALTYFLLKRFGHIDAVAKIKNFLKGIWQGLNSIRHMKRKAWFIFYSVLIWTLYLLSTTFGIYALQETTHLGLSGGLTTLAVGSVGMILTPGGIGAYPWLVQQLMLLYGINEETGTALGWLLWFVQTIIFVAGGVICLALISYHNKKKKDLETA